jgi:hypothetical protein
LWQLALLHGIVNLVCNIRCRQENDNTAFLLTLPTTKTAIVLADEAAPPECFKACHRNRYGKAPMVHPWHGLRLTLLLQVKESPG